MGHWISLDVHYNRCADFSYRSGVQEIGAITTDLGSLETMLLHEMSPQLKLPIKVMKGPMPLQCNTYFPKSLAI